MSIVLALAMAAAVGTADAPAADPAAAPAPPAQALPAAAPKKDPLDKVICKVQDTTGTRLGAKKVCATKREWEAKSRDDQETTSQIQQRAMSYRGAGG